MLGFGDLGAITSVSAKVSLTKWSLDQTAFVHGILLMNNDFSNRNVLKRAYVCQLRSAN